MKNSHKDQLDILFVLFDIGLYLENSAVFQSQVGDQMLALSSYGYRVGILTNYLDKEVFQEKIGNKLERGDIEIFVIKKKKNILFDLLSMSFKHTRIIKAYQVPQSYVRGLWGPIVIRLLKPWRRHKYIYDVRGDISNELEAVGGNSIKGGIYLWLEKWGILGAERVTAVTNTLGRIIKDRTSLSKEVMVIPCCINDTKGDLNSALLSEYRDRLGYKADQIVFVYSGGLSHYQQVPKMLALWTEFLKIENVRFLLLTNQDPHSHPTSIEHIKKFGNRLNHLKLPREEVIATVASCDIAFMLREDIPLNNAASPVKFAEYLASGAIIAGSPNIGDASMFIKENNLGVLIDPNDLKAAKQTLDDLLNDFNMEMRDQVRESSRGVLLSNYTWHSHKLTYADLYGQPKQNEN